MNNNKVNNIKGKYIYNFYIGFLNLNISSKILNIYKYTNYR